VLSCRTVNPQKLVSNRKASGSDTIAVRGMLARLPLKGVAFLLCCSLSGSLMMEGAETNSGAGSRAKSAVKMNGGAALGGFPTNRLIWLVSTGSVEQVAATLRVSPTVNLKVSAAEAGLGFNEGETLLHLAAERRNPNLVSLLLQRSADIDARDAEGWTPLMAVVSDSEREVDRTKCLETARVLANAGTEVNATNRAGRSALMLASYAGDQEVVALLLAKGANPNLGGVEGMQPLMQAAVMGHLEIVNQLLKAKAQVNAQTEEGFSALMWTCLLGQGQRSSVAAALTAAGADANARTKQGATPLMQATSVMANQSGLEAIRTVKLLIRSGADLRAANLEGETALSLAERSGLPHMVELLERGKAGQSLDEFSPAINKAYARAFIEDWRMLKRWIAVLTLEAVPTKPTRGQTSSDKGRSSRESAPQTAFLGLAKSLSQEAVKTEQAAKNFIYSPNLKQWKAFGDALDAFEVFCQKTTAQPEWQLAPRWRTEGLLSAVATNRRTFLSFQAR
jgi:uncharacterized protein